MGSSISVKVNDTQIQAQELKKKVQYGSWTSNVLLAIPTYFFNNCFLPIDFKRKDEELNK